MEKENEGKSAAEEQNEQQGEEHEQKQDTQDGDDGQQEQSGESEADKHRKAFEDQKRRAEKAEARVKELEAGDKGKARPAKKTEPDHSVFEQGLAKANERAERAEMVAAGYTHAEEQQFLRDAAKRLGVEPLEAAQDELVAGKIERMREARKTKDATPAPKGGGTAKKPPKNAWDMTEEEFQKEVSKTMSNRQ